MMKFFMFMISYFIFNLFNNYLIQFTYQNLMFLMLFMYMMLFPLNNLNYWLKMYYYLGCDFYSMGLIILSLWILSLMVIVSEMNLVNINKFNYMNLLVFMMLFLIICFMSMNMILFYLFFESSLIPIFILILGWGFKFERIQAGYYMMMYTLFGSLPLFIMILFLYQISCSLMFDFMEFYNFNFYIYVMINIAFLIKLPMYFFHLWLPKAHVEAPLIGSMILAGVMLKLGGYGLLRFMFLMVDMYILYNKYILIISLLGGVYASLICLCQVDMKMLVAYSSVVHMSILLGGLFTMFNMGILGSINMMIAHGLCSSGLFCLVNIIYERSGSRSLMINKGLINLFPSLSLMWFLLCSSNLSFPPSLNFFSEIMLFSIIVIWDIKMMVLLIFLMFFSALYSLYMYSYSQHGSINLNSLFKGIMIKEYLLLVLHWLPLNFMLFFIYFFM